MTKTIISTQDAPGAIGTYNQAVLAGDTLYISGQIPLDPATGEVVQGDFRARANQVFANLRAIAAAADMSLDDAAKITIYLTDLGEFATVNEVMAEHVAEPFPARAAVEVSGLPKGVDIEADAILVRC